ncbi:MAG: hypothetical protein H0T46_13240 [Deltaproteobacteria bacterium]|nr:hypothetical protein [Deltaproteobacteria bacterium]
MHAHLVGFLVSSTLVVGCATDNGSPQPATRPLPSGSGEFVGQYRVPTTSALEAAATYPVESVDWIVVNGLVTLHYDLPLGLVGGDVDVTLTGTFEPGATSVELTGAVGTGSCVATAASVISCTEVFTNLGALPISMPVVERIAALESVSVRDRGSLATQFASEPIGIVDIDLQAPYIEDEDDD